MTKDQIAEKFIQIFTENASRSISRVSGFQADWVLENFEPKREKTLAELTAGDWVAAMKPHGDFLRHEMVRVVNQTTITLSDACAFDRDTGLAKSGTDYRIRPLRLGETADVMARHQLTEKIRTTYADRLPLETLEKIAALIDGVPDGEG